MKLLAPFCTLLALTCAKTVEFEPLSDEEISYINNLPGGTWKAGRNFYPEELPRVIRMLGVNMTANAEYNRQHLTYKNIVVRNDLPDSFDARTQWPDCPSIGEIRDQGNCGSCWAFGSTEAISDRICIKGGGQVHISAEDVLECCNSCTHDGCAEGNMYVVYDWYVNTGIVTGGQYGSNEGCKPYSLPHCEHFTTGQYPTCIGQAPSPSCQTTCRSGYSKTYAEDKRRGSSSYKMKGEEKIMQDLVDNGPVTAAFDIYSDFLSYQFGIYRHVTGPRLGAHAVKIIGYGVENDVKYWLLANSWNPDWGEQGFFRILRGTNECRMEDNTCAGEPQL